MSYTPPLAQRVRPQHLDEVIGNTHATQSGSILRSIVDDTEPSPGTHTPTRRIGGETGRVCQSCRVLKSYSVALADLPQVRHKPLPLRLNSTLKPGFRLSNF